MVKYYAGIGSRLTPIELKPTIEYIVNFLEVKNYILRSGGANGADSFFEDGTKNSKIRSSAN